MKHSELELALEKARTEKFPDRPSRMSSAFASLVPRSRFAGHGQLYRVALVPGDPYFLADSTLIDKLWDIESKAVDNAYWKGVTVTKENLADIEVLAPRFRVLEKVEEGQAVIRIGDTIKLGVEIWVNFSGGEEDKFLSKMKDTGMEFSAYGHSARLPIGTVLKIRSAAPGKKAEGNNPWGDMTFDNPWQDGEQTYSSILHLSNESAKRLSKSIRNGTTQKL